MTDNRAKTLESTGVPCIVPKFDELWSVNGLKLDRSFYPAPSLNILFRSQSIAHAKRH